MKSYPLKYVFIISLVLLSKSAFSQLVGSDVFLQGKYLEVGIGSNGAFGSNSVPPPGYHADSWSSFIAFVSDPDKDGWTTGTPPHFGDFVLSGFQLEGWFFQSKGVTVGGVVGGTGGPFIAGTNITYNKTGNIVSSTCQGIIFPNIIVNQTTSMDTMGLYLNIDVTMYNSSATSIDSVYYMRILEPDCDDSFITNNIIEHQLPNDSNLVVVSAASSSYPQGYIGLGTVDHRAKAFINPFWGGSYDHLEKIYNQTEPIGAYYYNRDSLVHADIAIGMIYNLGHFSPHETKKISYIYAFKPLLIDSATHITDSIGRVNQVSIVTMPDITIYPNPCHDVGFVSGIDASDEVSVYDTWGRKINACKNAISDNTGTITLKGLPTGSYFLIVRGIHGEVKMKTVLQKM
jgi:hypothetical protein